MNLHCILLNREVSYIRPDIISKDDIDAFHLSASNLISNFEVEEEDSHQVWIINTLKLYKMLKSLIFKESGKLEATIGKLVKRDIFRSH